MNLQGLGAQVFQHQPSILQTALPGVADRALLRLMSDISSRYSTLRATSGEAPPVLVHAMSNAGFVAFGTMLHLTSLANPAALPRGAPGSPAASLKPQLQTDWKSAPGAGGGAGPSQDGWQAGSPRQAATRSGEDGESSGGLCVSGSGSQGDVLSGFKQVLHHTQGIVLDSGKQSARQLHCTRLICWLKSYWAGGRPGSSRDVLRAPPYSIRQCGHRLCLCTLAFSVWA